MQWRWSDLVISLTQAGLPLTEVRALTISQALALGRALDRAHRRRRTESLVILRASQYEPRAFEQLLDASRDLPWLIPPN